MQIKPKELLRTLGKAYIVLTLLVLTRPFVSFLGPESGEFGGKIFYILFGLYIIIVPIALARLGRFVWVASRDKPLMFLIGFALISVLWSYAPAATLRQIMVFMGEGFLGVYVAMHYSLREQIGIFSWVLGIAAVLSLFVALIFPTIGIGSKGMAEAWTGIYDHKNVLGTLMALSAILFLLLTGDFRQKWVAWGGFSLSVTLVLLARSLTPLLAVIGILCLMPLYHSLRWRDMRAKAIVIFAGVLVVSVTIVIFAANPEPFFRAAGRDPVQNTFVGRIQLWDDLLHKVEKRPLLGYGLGGFWLGWEGESADIWAKYGWNPPHAHNGYLDIWLDLGLIGLGLMLCHIFLNFRRGIVLMRSTGATEDLWALAYLTFVSFTSLTGVTLITRRAGIFWALYVALSLSMCIQLRRMAIASTEHKQLPSAKKPNGKKRPSRAE
jgi:exopolysaccharide production protein ExoQ